MEQIICQNLAKIASGKWVQILNWVHVYSKFNEEHTCKLYFKYSTTPHSYLKTVMWTFFLTTWPLQCVLLWRCTRKMTSIFTWLCILFRICRGWKIWMSHRVDSVCCWNAWISWVMRHVGCSICHRWCDTPHCRHNRQGRLLLTVTLCSLWPHDGWCITAK